MNDDTTREVAVIGDHEDGGVLGTLARAETDTQIATAKKYPRSVRRFMDDARALVTLNEEVAGECMYALPRGGKSIEGPSARFAEIILSCWGNSHAAARVIGEDEKFVTAQAVVWDMEKNVKVSFETRRRITNKYGKRYDDDLIGVTGNAAASIAFRNAILKVIPKAFTNQLYLEARRVAIGDAKTLSSRRAGALSALGKMGVTEDMILAKLERNGSDDIGLDDLAVLRGFFTAIRDEGASIESVFDRPTTGGRASASDITPPSANGRKKAEPEPPPRVDSGPNPGEVAGLGEDDADESPAFKALEYRIEGGGDDTYPALRAAVKEAVYHEQITETQGKSLRAAIDRYADEVPY